MVNTRRFPHVDRWNYSREKDRTIKLDPFSDGWYAIAREDDQEITRAKGPTPILAMRALDRVLGEIL
jgi:hypothetical protein